MHIDPATAATPETAAGAEPATLFFDVDGTLVWYPDGLPVEEAKRARPAPAVYDAFRRLRANGHAPFICTGRSYGMVTPQLLELDTAGIVCGAGTTVVIDGEVVYDVCIEPDVLEQTVNKLVELGCDLIFEANEQAVLLLGSGAQDNADWHGFPVVHSFDDMRAVVPSLTYTKFCYTDDQLPKLQQAMDFFMQHYDICDLGIGKGEMTIKGVNKGTGIAHALKALGRTVKNSYGFGDSENDLAMLAAVETPVAMGNALPQVKECCAYVTDSVQDDGTVTALEHFGLI